MKTGYITPRDYGITIQKDNERLFLSPMKYILSKVMLETPRQIRTRIKSHANKIEEDPKKLEQRFAKAVRKKEGTKNLLNISKRDLLNNTTKYTKNYISQVQSKSSNELHDVHLLNSNPNSIGYEQINCSCPDKIYNDVKSFQSMCIHLGTLEIALKEDSILTYDSNRNNTGLTNNQLKYLPKLAFNLLEKETQNTINNALFNYYLENKTSYQINRELLKNKEIFSKELQTLIKDNADIVQYRPTRQRDKNIILPTRQEKEFHGAINSLQKRIHFELIQKGFEFDGYSLEEINMEESIAFRYKNGFQTMNICNFEDKPPVIIQKNLGNKTNKNYSEQTNLNSPYLSVDDATRRESINKIIIPGTQEYSKVFVPQLLKKEYEKLMQQ